MAECPERYNASLLLDGNLEAARGSRVAIYCGNEQVTYGELFERVCAMGRALRALGVEREQRVLLFLDDTLAFPIAFFGAIRIGAVPVPVNPLYRVEDYRYFVEDSSASVAVSEPAYLEKLTQALEGHAEPPSVIVTGEPSQGRHALADLLAEHRGELAPADTHRDDMAFWLYSSGSTGRPKGVVHLQRNMPFTCNSYARNVIGITDADLVFSRVLFHAYGLGNCLSFPFSAGAATVLNPGRPAPQSIMETVQRHRPTLFCMVPTLYNAILNDPASDRYDLSSIRLCVSAAEPLPPETWRRWKERFGLSILDGIGTTEMLHIFCSNTVEAFRPGSSGRPVPGYELGLVDSGGQPVPPGVVGDLIVKGDSAAAFYWHQREKSRRTFRGEWVATGDRYRCDEEGFYWYEGRSDDMIKVGGEWVSPIEIENALLEHPAVHEVAVVGVLVEGFMRIKATVVCGTGQDPTPTLIGNLQDWCKGRLQRYQYPHQIEFIAELPKTATGKIQRYKLRDRG